MGVKTIGYDTTNVLELYISTDKIISFILKKVHVNIMIKMLFIDFTFLLHNYGEFISTCITDCHWPILSHKTALLLPESLETDI